MNGDEQEQAKPFTFRNCITKVKEIYESNSLLDNMFKLDEIQQLLRKYFEDEDPADVFEGFVHLVLFLEKISTTVAKQHDLSLVKLGLTAYYDLLKKRPELTENMPELNDPTLVSDALKILSELKYKHAQMISTVLHLNDASMTSIAKNMISGILKANDYAKAVQWMVHLNLRDHFPFKQIVCTLIVENQIAVLDLFIGEAEYRGKMIVEYLDKLVQDYLQHRHGVDENEQKLIGDHKRIQKLAIRYVKNYGMNDDEIPNVMNSRAYEALMYHHYCWKNGERSWDHFEEVALPPLQRPEIRDMYFNYLCDHGMANKALHFAQLLHLPLSSCPRKLCNFVQQNPTMLDIVEEDINKKCDIRKKNEEIESNSSCVLDDGTPVVTIDTLDAFLELIEVLRKGGEKTIGIDAEWRPHFLSTTERISIIQLAISKAVYLIDVLWLEEKLNLAEDHWLNFFDALFCNDARKIGYDFRNDIRVIKSTFPFLAKIFHLAQNVICLYKLLQQIVLMPEASRLVFGSNPPRNLALSDVTQFFLKIQLEKNERIGNWSQRPLRLEQKKYAALDAYALVKLYMEIAPLIRRLREDQQLALQECALIKISPIEEKQQLQACIMSSGQVGRIKEGESDFVENIQKASAELSNGPSGSEGMAKSIDDVRFVADSMLFGLGKNLRKCGFDTRLIGDRSKIVDFCQMEANDDFIVLSTGKGHKQLENILGKNRCLFVPVSTHTGAVPPSVLVNHVIRELKIIVRQEDMWSRCIECNKRAFVPIPKQIVQVIFYMNVVRANAEWLGITEDDLNNSVQMLRDQSELTVQISERMHTGEHPKQSRKLLDESGYYLYEDEQHVICETRYCAVDIINKLLLAEGRGAPVSIEIGLKYKKETFDETDLHFFVCVECGKVQFNNPSSED